MSVTEDLELPNQPTTGGVFQTPLGGDGFISPIHRQDADMKVTGDATGGVIRHRFILDKRHSYIFNLMAINTTDPGADVPHIVQLGMREEIQYTQVVTSEYQAFTAVPRSRCIWAPPSFFFPGGPDPEEDIPYIQVSTQNVNALEVNVTIQLLAFDIEALRRVPYDQLINNKPF